MRRPDDAELDGTERAVFISRHVVAVVTGLSPPLLLRSIFSGVVLLPLACGVACAEDGGSSQPAPVVMSAEAQKIEGLETARAVMGTVERVLPAMAQIRPDERGVVTIRPAGSGKIVAVHVMPGQPVKRGQSLIDYIDHALHVAHLRKDQDRATLAAAVATQKEARLSYDRARVLSGGAVAAGEVRRRAAILQQADAAVTAQESALGMINHQFHEEFTSVTERIVRDELSALISPVDGVVLDVKAAAGGDVTPGMDLATVADLSRVWLVAWIAPEDASLLTVGAGMDGRPADQNQGLAGGAGGWTVRARITTIAQAADPVTGLLRVIAEVPNGSGALRPGVMMDAGLHTTERQAGVVVPSEAVQRSGSQDVVFVRAGADRFRPVMVRAGLEEADRTVVLSGLRAGDEVVTKGSFALKSIGALATLGDSD
ncbi:efflux RND transporter periplasmic adaptor subunit [Acetobacter fallax]|uniref:Efflux RND transporter periplasmic adaptor subunit n=1 Tax=Acetobacter fallax TaxID=1737473 RepID=A0ABX0K884_9PROT|nr:efflux RND transporter periplasmic adaptor subunit [Acetobacter fallax]NHO32619.1 efflux RND transporter periplasmic adaptor subunit [Acetobacter fallax]NHO36183.1 efflux RND transporter periplasmic adaptor subunit [Acetobacter fallax]